MDSSLYLQRIGVTAWRWRERAPTPQPLCIDKVHVYTLSAVSGVVGLLLADASHAMAEEASLVEAIAAATQREPRGGFQPVWTAAWTALPPVVIALGERVATALHGAPVAIPTLRGQLLPLPNGGQLAVSHAPAALLNDRSLKAQTWQDVQLAMGMMA